jgi:tetratricopeptide (TPR) repeat protein
MSDLVYPTAVACPDDQTLLAMLEHSIDPARFGELEVHIDTCAHCRKAVAALALGSRSPSTPHEPFSEVERVAGAELAIGATIHDRYTVASEIGRGGMGTVYVAHDATLGRDVALKLHRAGSGPAGSGAKDRLRREAIAMAKLAHPNVVNVFEVDSLDDRLFVAMEYVRGGTLRSWLAAKPRGWREIVAMLIGAGRGLAAAHAAGLVHRDFKPENVLVGIASGEASERPRVGDFGLARVDAPTYAPLATTPVIADAPTVTQGLAGTPAYMAPEQLAGDPVDARSDQFAFCVVAWECLTGKRPFGGTTLAALQLAIEKHDFAKTQLDDRVRRVLERGLAVDPAERYPDMTALLAALERAAAPRTTRNAITTVVAASVIGAGAFATYTLVTAHQREAACVRAGDEVRALFGPIAHATMRDGFIASRSPFALGAYEHAAPALDRYDAGLAEQAVAVCRDRDQSERVIAARRACVASHATELAGLVDQFIHADAALVGHAPDAAWAVFDPTPCTDAVPSASNQLSTEDAARLGHIKALSRTGKYKDGLALAMPLLADARAHKDKSLELDLLMVLGELQDELDPAAAVVSYHDAEALAEAQGRDLDAAEALNRLANAAGTVQHDYVAAHRQIELARAKLARVGGNTALEATITTTEAQVLTDENRLGEADVAMRRAVTMLEHVYGPDHPAVGNAYGQLSEIERGLGHNAEALAAANRTLAILGPALGPDHPTVAGSKMNLASVLIQTHDLERARKLLVEADRSFLATYGADHPLRAAIYGNIGTLEMTAEHYEAAAAAFRTARSIIERTTNDPAALAGTERDLTQALGSANKLDEALVEAKQGIALLEKLGPDGAPRLAEGLDDLCEVQLARGHAAEAIPVAERALALVTERGVGANPGDVADTQFIYARLLWEVNRDRPRARAMIEHAHDAHPDADRKALMAAWLQAHAR